jgi:hypothetical protein
MAGPGGEFMELFRIYAFAVTPQRTTDEKSLPSGGAFSVNDEIRGALDKLYASSKLATQATADFRVDGDDNLRQRKHAVRELVMNFAFGATAQARLAAHTLAARLGDSMDERSPPTLLLLSACRDGVKRRATIWAFPQDEAFQFRSGKNRATIRLLNDIFSRSSRLRKAALFEGNQRRTDFWSGRVLDLQTTGGFGKGADYWIGTFLDCRLGLEGEAGTRLLVQHLRQTYESLDDHDGRDQLYSAMVAIRTSPKQTWSLRQFASHFLTGEAKKAFIASVPQELAYLSFKFDRRAFEGKLNFRIFRLEDDVYVSAPFGAIGNSVQITEGQQRQLQCQGVVVDERVRARHA